MICVIATIEVVPGRRDELLAASNEVVPAVRAEKGCIEYGARIDVASGLPAQGPVRENTVVMIEKWESLAALEAHLKTPHMTDYFRKTGPMRRGMTLQVLGPA